MKKCKECKWKFYKFVRLEDLSKAYFKCPKCGSTTLGYTDASGNFLGKVRGRRKQNEEENTKND